MAQTPTIDVLLNRFQDEVHSVFYPFLIMSVVATKGPITKDEIRDEILRRAHGWFEKEASAHNRLVGRIEKTFGLIAPVKKSSDSSAVRFQLTAKGKKLYEASLDRVIFPLVDALTDE